MGLCAKPGELWSCFRLGTGLAKEQGVRYYIH